MHMSQNLHSVSFYFIFFHFIRIIKNAVMKMDSSIINKEGIEKLLTMLPSEEEVSRIEEAQEVNPELPLGTAEQFLITLSSINGLEVIHSPLIGQYS